MFYNCICIVVINSTVHFIVLINGIINKAIHAHLCLYVHMHDVMMMSAHLNLFGTKKTFMCVFLFVYLSKFGAATITPTLLAKQTHAHTQTHMHFRLQICSEATTFWSPAPNAFIISGEMLHAIRCCRLHLSRYNKSHFCI